MSIPLLQSCGDDGEFDNLTIQPELQPYFDKFAEEGNKRIVDINFDLYPVTGEVTDIEDTNVAGRCYHVENHPNHIEIDIDIWNSSNELLKEYFVFHELAHCYLGRDHLEMSLANGDCASIMASGKESCRINYTMQTREYYLDELYQQ